MAMIIVNRASKQSIPFAITQNGSAYDLTGKRVTWSVGVPGNVIIRKDGGVSQLYGGVTINSPTTLGTGSIALAVADYAVLPTGKYQATLWVDTPGNGDDQVSSIDEIIITPNESRT